MRNIEQIIHKYRQPLKCRQNSASLPWLNSDVHQLMKKRDIALKKSLLTKTQTDILSFKSLRNKVVSETRKVKTAYFEQLIIESGENSSSFWKCINKLSKREGIQRKRSGYYGNLGSLRAGTRHHGDFSVMGTPSLQPFLKSYWLTPVK